MKACSRCGAQKESIEFTKDSRRKDGLRSYCKECASKEKTAYRAANPDIVRERNHEHHLKRWPVKGKSINRTKAIRRVICAMAGTNQLWEISERLGLAEVTVRQRAAKHGISLAVNRPRWSDEDNQSLIGLHSQGLTQREIGKNIGRTTGAVRLQIAKLRREGVIT